MFYLLLTWMLRKLGFDIRGIFYFFDGRRRRAIDPMVVCRKLWTLDVEYRELRNSKIAERYDFDRIQSLLTGDLESISQYYLIVAQAAQHAFGVKPLEQGGLTEVECEWLIRRFEKYVGDVKKNIKTKPISRTSSDANKVEGTNTDLDSGSTSTEPSYEMPDVSGLELAMPGDLMK